MFARKLDRISIDGPWRGEVLSRRACWPKLMALAAILKLAHWLADVQTQSPKGQVCMFTLEFALQSQGFMVLNQRRPINDPFPMEVYPTMLDYGGEVFASQTPQQGHSLMT